MSRFGWSYPPGAAGDPNAPWNQVDPPCAVCGNDCDDCICPECPACKSIGATSCYVGDPKYTGCGLERSAAQIASLAAAEQRWAAENAEHDYKPEEE